MGAALGVGALLTVLSSSGGIDDVREALERVSAGWTLQQSRSAAPDQVPKPALAHAADALDCDCSHLI